MIRLVPKSVKEWKDIIRLVLIITKELTLAEDVCMLELVELFDVPLQAEFCDNEARLISNSLESVGERDPTFDVIVNSI